MCEADGAVLDLLVIASERERLIGTTILGRYAVDGVLGDGGMGVVYRATDTETGKRYAVKVLRAEYSDEEDLVVRFEQEARAAASVNNPHIVEIYDWGSLPDGSRFFVMEYLEGRSLGDVLAQMPKPAGSDRRQPMSEEFVIHLALQVCDGLGAAHAKGIVHRDIKPDNFHVIRRDGEPYFVKILDFGIAKVQNSKIARTRTGSVFGTPHYMSPEQANGDRDIDHKTDIYGLGVLMYEMATGKVPFDADNLMGILTAHLYHTPVQPRVYPECERMSPAFEAVILKCLAKTRDARYQSLDEVRIDLERCRAGQSSLALDDLDMATVQFHRDSLPPIFSGAPSLDGPSAPPPGDGAWGAKARPGATISGRLPARTMGPPSVRPMDTVAGVSRAPPPGPSSRRRRVWLVGVGVVVAGVVLGVGGFALLNKADAPTVDVPPLAVQVHPSDAAAAPSMPRPVAMPAPAVDAAVVRPPSTPTVPTVPQQVLPAPRARVDAPVAGDRDANRRRRRRDVVGPVHGHPLTLPTTPSTPVHEDGLHNPWN